MIKSKDLISKTIIEITKPFVIVDGEPGKAALDNSIKRITVNAGEQCEVIKCAKRNGAFVLEIKQTTAPYKEGKQWLTYCSNYFKIISNAPTLNANYKPNEPHLNANEEFVIIHKEKPNLYILSVNYSLGKHELREHTNDNIIENDLIFTDKKSQRKRLKNVQALHGFLMNLTPIQNEFYSELNKDALYHLHPLFNIPNWTVNVSSIDIEILKSLELRKYNTTTKQVYAETVDFDIYKSVVGKIKKFHLTKKYGEAVSYIYSRLKKEDKIMDYPFLLSIKFSDDFFKNKSYKESCFTEKDVIFDNTIKLLKIKKSDNFNYQNNSFSCIAFETEEKAIAFKNAYKSTNRTIEILNTNDVLNEYNVDLNHIKNNKKSLSSKF